MAQHKPKKQRIQDALKAIKDNKLFFVTDIPPLIGISTARFYQLKLEKVEAIKDALEKNRVEIKSSLRNKWYKSDNPTLQIGLYKLLGTEEEYQRLSNTKIEVNGEHVVTPPIQWLKPTIEDDE